jgi:hypothetical protein
VSALLDVRPDPADDEWEDPAGSFADAEAGSVSSAHGQPLIDASDEEPFDDAFDAERFGVESFDGEPFDGEPCDAGEEEAGSLGRSGVRLAAPSPAADRSRAASSSAYDQMDRSSDSSYDSDEAAASVAAGSDASDPEKRDGMKETESLLSSVAGSTGRFASTVSFGSDDGCRKTISGARKMTVKSEPSM